MTMPIQFPNEDKSNAARKTIAGQEPLALRTFTPTQAVLTKSAGVYHWTSEGRRLYDYSSGVLVANLGHNPRRWMKRFAGYLGWKPEHIAESQDSPPLHGGTNQNSPPLQGAADNNSPPLQGAADNNSPPFQGRSNKNSPPLQGGAGGGDFFEAVTLTAYNAVTPIEAAAVERLIKNVQASPGGGRLDTVMWSASGSEAIQKALWACLHYHEDRDIIVATRYGFHGKKGLAGAVTGCETDRDRDPRVKFISFPREEVDDVSRYGQKIDLSTYHAELTALWDEYGRRINCLITEPYLGGGGSYHPPVSYMKLLQDFCREHDVLLILDEVQSNFGRTGCMYAFEKYEIEPDFVCLGKGLGNGVPVSGVVGRGEIMSSLKYGEASDTWSANPLACAAVLATLDEFESTDVLENTRRLSEIFFEGLGRLKATGVICKVRGEGMVFGIECAPVGDLPAEDVANAVVEACYLGKDGGEGIHLLGPLANTVLRVSPPMTMTEEEARISLDLLYAIIDQLAKRLLQSPAEANVR